MRLLFPVVFAFSFVVGCSSASTGTGEEEPRPSPSGGGAGGGTPGCKMTLSGAQTGEYPCAVSAGFDVAENVASVAVLTVQSTSPYGSGFVKVKGEAAPRSVSFAAAADGGFTWKKELTELSTPTWSALKDPEDPSYNRGDFTMVLTSVAVRAIDDGKKIYEVHGSMKSTLPFLADSGATGTVEVTVTF